MKKIKILSLAVLSLTLVAAFQIAAAANKYQGSNDESQKPVQQLALYEKDPATWEIIDGGALGKLNYFVEEGKFGFGAHKLDAGLSYTLIYYPDPWPGNGLKCLGSGTTDGIGDINIKGTFDFTSIPIEGDENYPGAKIWLVLTGDVDCEGTDGSTNMIAWQPAEYLFENNLIESDSESASYTTYHGNGIYSTTHILRKDDVIKPEKTPKKTATQGPACYKLMGVSWPSAPDYVAQTPELLGIATTSIGTWDAATAFSLLGNGAIDTGAGFSATQDWKNSYSMGNYPLDGVIAVCRTWRDSIGNILEYDIMFDTDFSWGDCAAIGEDCTEKMDLQNIATHEIGHAFGLLDLYQKPCGEVTMFGYSWYGDISKRDLAPQDITGLQSIYGI